MNATETARICDAISQIKPAQRFDTETPAFWAVILGDIRYEDARQAVLNLGGRQQFIDPSDIITEVRRIRDDRVDRTEMPVPNASPDDPAGYAVEYRALRLAIADGTLAGDRLEAYRRGEISLTGRPVLTGPMSPPDPDTGPAIVREALERKQQADIARDAAERAAAEAARRAEEAERARQIDAIAQIPTEVADPSLTAPYGMASPTAPTVALPIGQPVDLDSLGLGAVLRATCGGRRRTAVRTEAQPRLWHIQSEPDHCLNADVCRSEFLADVEVLHPGITLAGEGE